MTISPDERRIIPDALQALSGVCDGANKQDTMGFNKFDSDFGKSLALQSMTTPLSDNQIITAAKMLKKYRNQLEGFGIHLPEELVKIASENKPEVWVEKGRIFVNFPHRPNDTILAQIRLVPDLLAFNDETVARAVFSSGIPVISAVGYETDFSICDFVADLRAPTPSAAAELATPDQAALREAFARAQRQLGRRMQGRMQRDSQRLDHLAHRLRQRHPATRLADQARRLRGLRAALERGVVRALESRALRLDAFARRLATCRPDRTLNALAGRVGAARRSLDRLALAAVRARGQRLTSAFHQPQWKKFLGSNPRKFYGLA